MVKSAETTRRNVTVLCVPCSPKAFAALRETLSHSQIQIFTATSRDQAVALCVARSVSFALIEGEAVRGQELSLAAALKFVRPFLPIILWEERRRPVTDMPENVDAIAHTPEDLLNRVDELLNKSGAGKPALPV